MPEADAWEPWTPRVGQRVRVRLSGECDCEDMWEMRAGNGKTGTVSRCGYPNAGHDYVVRLDTPLVMGGDSLYGTEHSIVALFLAAVELEPLEPVEDPAP